MPKRTSSYRAWQLEKLSDPRIAANYLNAALEDSPDGFLTALGKVAQARPRKRTGKGGRITFTPVAA
jgi:DNA-binding phage protein